MTVWSIAGPVLTIGKHGSSEYAEQKDEGEFRLLHLPIIVFKFWYWKLSVGDLHSMSGAGVESNFR
jgi:hypothetical protein